MKIFSRDKGMPEAKPFDVNQLEDEIREMLPAIEYAPVPKYNAEDLGKITAEAVKASHEAAAQAITELGLAASARVDRLNQIKAEADELAKACLDLAAKYREKGEREAEQMEQTHRANNEAREIIKAMHEKINGDRAD